MKNVKTRSSVCSCQWISNSSKIRDGGGTRRLQEDGHWKWLRLDGCARQFGVTRAAQNTRLQWRCMLVDGQELDSFNTQEILNVSSTSFHRPSTIFLKLFLQGCRQVKPRMLEQFPFAWKRLEKVLISFNCENSTCYFSAFFVVNKIQSFRLDSCFGQV